MNKGEELLKMWEIVAKKNTECKKIFKVVAEILEKDGYEAFPLFYEGSAIWRLKGEEEELPTLWGNCRQAYRKGGEEEKGEWFGVQIVFDRDILEPLNFNVPVIVAVKPNFDEDLEKELLEKRGKKKKNRETPSQFFNFLVGEDEKASPKYFKKMPLLDGSVGEYYWDEPWDEGTIMRWRANVICRPLVEISNSDDIQEKLIKPLLGETN